MLLVKNELDAVNKQLSNISFEQENVNPVINEFLCGGSKRIRTILSSLYFKAFGCKLSAKSIKIMTAGEIIHNASLLHDDVIDNAKIRRGKTTVSEKFSPYISILIGDSLLAAATEILLEINNNEILKIFLDCTKEMCSSEIHQFFLRGQKPSIDDYINICEGKTAKLFEAIMQSCALEEGVNRHDSLEFARNFGILFQLKNDLEVNSAKSDALNNIFTPKDFLGIEKTTILIDNYQQKVRKAIDCLPDNEYKKGLEDLLSKL